MSSTASIMVAPLLLVLQVMLAGGVSAGRVVTVDPLRLSLRDARDTVRAHLAAGGGEPVVVELLPGMHNVGAGLALGPQDGGADPAQPVVWRSADPSDPAVIGAPIRVTGPWKPHASIKGALVASLPPNVTKGATLRHFWVGGTRATRPTVFACGGDSSRGGARSCNDWASHAQFNFNFSLTSNTSTYPMGSQYDTSRDPSVGDPSAWPNPQDVEFVFSSCRGFNCWVEPRCPVEAVVGHNKVRLRQSTGNSSCYHRLYYFGDGWGGKPEGKAPVAPTSIENLFDAKNFTATGTFYYDRSAGTITYQPRPGETAATLAASAITATTEQLLVVNRTKNLVFSHTKFQYATSLHASGDRGFVDTQSAYLYKDGEPPVNIHVATSSNISFASCAFSHLGGVYGIGVDLGSQDVLVTNSTFSDISGGGIKLGSSGERGAPAPNITLDPALQDRGFLVSDCLMDSIPVEYGSANPIFGGYIADSILSHNTIINSAYSAVCLVSIDRNLFTTH